MSIEQNEKMFLSLSTKNGGKIKIERNSLPGNDEIVFIPIDENYSEGKIEKIVLGQLDIERPEMYDNGSVHNMYWIYNRGSFTLVYIVAYSPYRDSVDLVASNLLAALGKLRSMGIESRSAWLPLLGTGPAGASPIASFRSILSAFKKFEELEERALFPYLRISIPNEYEGDFQNIIDVVGNDFAGRYYVDNAVPMKNEGGEAQVWALQYDRKEYSNDPVENMKAGASLSFFWSNPTIAGKMRVGDPVIYLRRGDGPDRGGMVGTGVVNDTTAIEKENTIGTTVLQMRPDQIIPRDEIIAYLGTDRPNWPGMGLEPVTPADATKLNGLLIERESWNPIFPPSGTNPTREDVPLRRDDAQVEVDLLNRVPLAVYFAQILHQIWCATQEGPEAYAAKKLPSRRHKPWRQDTLTPPAFVAHIDAPWGGGKTSFSNYVATTLNPEPLEPSDGSETIKGPFSAVFPNRKDLSGAFLPEANRPGQLKKPDGSYKTEEEYRRPWIVVNINAWLHQHVDPPWWVFYEKIRRTCLKEIWEFGVPVVNQTGTGDYSAESKPERCMAAGFWLREVIWCLFTPQLTKIAVTAALISTVYFAYYFLGPLFNWIGDFFVVTGLEDHPQPAPDALPGSPSPADRIVDGLALFGIAGTTIWTIFSFATSTLLPGTPSSARNYSLGSSDPLDRFRKHFAEMMERVKRPVLVVVDDLDRCDPKFIVEMTRGIQLILRSKRVVFLLLGDRKWIEQSFAIHHAEMKEIFKESDQEFGGRFVEKAIQLSYVLPDMGGRKASYVHSILDNDSEADAKREHDRSVGPNSDSIPSDASTKPGEERGSQPTPSDGASTAAPKGAEQTENEKLDERIEAVLARAKDTSSTARKIGHRLKPLAEHFPDNPRHVKRVVNAISLYQNSLILSDEDISLTRAGGRHWREMVVCVVMMLGYPKAWATLLENPEWADFLIGDGTVASVGPGYEKLKRNQKLVSLMKDVELEDVEKSDTLVETVITTEVIRRMQKILPDN